MELQGKTVYIVHVFGPDGSAESYEVFAAKDDAIDAVEDYDGPGHSYYDVTTIN